MADFGINWGAIEQPNILGGYLQGQQVRQKQDDNAYERQRNVLADQRDAEKFALQKEQYGLEKRKTEQALGNDERDQMLKGYGTLYNITSQIKTPQDLDKLKTNPQFSALYQELAPVLKLDTPLAQTTFEQLQQFNAIAPQLAERKLFQFKGALVSAGEGGQDPHVVYQTPEDPLDKALKESLIRQRSSSAGAADARADRTRKMPIGRPGGGRGGGSSGLPPGFVLD